MAGSAKNTTLVRGADGLIYEVSPRGSQVAGRNARQAADMPPMTAGLGFYGILDRAASRAMIDDGGTSASSLDGSLEDRVGSRAMIELEGAYRPASTRAMITPGT